VRVRLDEAGRRRFALFAVAAAPSGDGDRSR